MNDEPRILVTEDKWMRLKGRLDPVDEIVIKEAAGGQELTFMSLRETFEAMQAETPEKYAGVVKSMEQKAGRTLTMEQLIEYSRAGQKTFREFENWTQKMTREQAEKVRHLRIDEHCTWRTIARTCYIWGFGQWYPPYNELMGMALCKRAAEQFLEDFMKEPWD